MVGIGGRVGRCRLQLLGASHSRPSPPSYPLRPSLPQSSVAVAVSNSCNIVDLHRRGVYSDVETLGTAPEPARRFTIYLVGPRVLYCNNEAVDLLRSGDNHHVEFKSMKGSSLLYWEGCLYPVPDSRHAIFNDTTLKLKEKNILSRFFKLVQTQIVVA
ncbi:Rab escort protein 1 [Zea mays]|uniref:Rab escort protein 1 n=1 Tax=Zea mays TaxID=4577 RepID=A0A3L6EP61_MAIZE|nr:Rab escort protein 1 [Zea mays]